MIKISHIKIIFVIILILVVTQTESKFNRGFYNYYYDYPNYYVNDFNHANNYIDSSHLNYKIYYYGKPSLKKTYSYNDYYPKCLTTRSKCWSDNECCGLECIKFIDHFPGVCGRDE